MMGDLQNGGGGSLLPPIFPFTFSGGASGIVPCPFKV